MPRTIILFACVAVFQLPPATSYADNVAEEDGAAVQKFLKEKYPNDTWGRGPTRLSSKPIEAAYPQARFYFIFSPQYPVSREGQISAVVQIDGEGATRRMENPKDYNQGLMGVANEGDAKTAAAAIMSLMLGPMGPQDVATDDVKVVAAGGGWTATATKPQGRWEVAFDGQGQCTASSYKHTAPLPICIGGLFRVTAVPQGVSVGGESAAAGLLVDSVELSSIAELAGLQKGDLVIGFDGRPLPNSDTIQQMRQTVFALKQQKGVSRKVTLIRNGQIMTAILKW